jgi:hypothetical protein
MSAVEYDGDAYKREFQEAVAAGDVERAQRILDEMERVLAAKRDADRSEA